MSIKVNYKKNGEIDSKTPLEPFYEAMLPLLVNYGFTEKFPEGRISTMDGGYTGYEYDIFIGSPLNGFRYKNVMPGGYSEFYDEQRTLESIGLSHLETGEEIFIRIEINNPYSGNKLSLTLEISGAEGEVGKLKNAFAPVLANYNFKSQNAGDKTAEAKTPFEIVLLNVIHGFWNENGFVDAVVSNYFCRVPGNWTIDGTLKEEFAEKFFLDKFGQFWKTGSSSDPYRLVASYNSSVLDRRLSEETNWSEMETDDRNRCQFYIASESGEIKAVYAKDFKKQEFYMQAPSILKEMNNLDSPRHIGGIGNFMQPLCEKFSEDEMDILGWVSSRGWKPNDEFCAECSELYEKGLAWKFL